MNSLTITKLIACLAIIFLAGGAAGGVIILKHTRAHEARPASMEKVCIRVQDRLKSKLGLTEEQMKRLQPIFDQTAQDLQAVRFQAIRDTDQIICRAHHQIAQELNADQKRKLEEFDKERRDWMQRRVQEPDAVKQQ